MWWRGWIGVLILGCLAECFVRGFLCSPYYLQDDSDFRWLYASSRSFIYSFEGYAVKKSNEEGFLDESWANRSSDAEPVIVFGDSFIEGLQVDDGEDFNRQLTALLPGYHFYSLARSGFGPAHYLVALQRWQSAIRAQRAIVLINDGDLADLDDPMIRWHYVSRGGKSSVDSFVMERSPDEPLKRLFIPVLRASALANFLYLKWNGRLLKLVSPSKVVKPEIMLSDEAMNARIEKLCFVLQKMKESLHVHLIYEPRVRVTSPDDLSPAFPHLYETLRVLLRRFDDQMLDMLPLYKAHWRQGTLAHGFSNSSPGEGHWNARGHAWASRAVADHFFGATKARGSLTP